MTVQSYCTRNDIVNICGEASMIAAIDDDNDGVVSAADWDKVDAVIEWAAGQINMRVRNQYVMSEVTSNAWLKWANAELAVYRLRTRKNNPAEASNEQNYQDIMKLLNEVRWGREQLPDQSPSFDHLPSVSNFVPQLGKHPMPIRVAEDESTTTRPEGNRQRYTTDQPGYGFW